MGAGALGAPETEASFEHPNPAHSARIHNVETNFIRRPKPYLKLRAIGTGNSIRTDSKNTSKASLNPKDFILGNPPQHWPQNPEALGRPPSEGLSAGVIEIRGNLKTSPLNQPLICLSGVFERP
jgi:hypothetical protein